MTSIRNRIISGAVWTTAETWCRHAAMFVIFVVLARLLGPEALGFTALAFVVPTLLTVPVTQGIPDALVQRQHIEPIHLDSAFWLLVAVGGVLSILVWTFAGVIAAAFGEPLLEDLVRWTSVIVAIQAVAAVPGAILKRQLNFRLFALCTLVGTAVGGALGIGMAFAGFDVWSLVAMQIAKSIAGTTILFLGSAWRPRLRYSHASCRELFGFAGPLVVQSLWTLCNIEMPKVVLGAYFGPGAVGLYALARRPIDLLTDLLLNPLNAVAMPAVSRVQSEPAKIDAFFDTTVRVAALAGFPAFVGLAAIAPVAVPFIFGEHWGGAVVATQILTLLGLQRTIDTLCSLTILALGHSGLLLKVNITYTVLAAILLPAAAQISLEATMTALVICNIALLPIFLFLAYRIVRINVLKPLAIFPRLTTAAALMLGAVTAWQIGAPTDAPPVVVVGCGIIIGAIVYGAAAIVLVRSDLLMARDTLLKLRG